MLHSLMLTSNCFVTIIPSYYYSAYVHRMSNAFTNAGKKEAICGLQHQAHFALNAALRGRLTFCRINSVIDRARRHGYCPANRPSLEELCDAADDRLLGKIVRFPYHVLHLLLPPTTTASQNYNLLRRTHTLQLPTHPTHLMDCTFFIRVLYKDA